MPGYPILDKDKDNLEDKFICEYCQSVLRDATRASCGHFFCSSCVKYLFLDSPQGVCSTTGITLFHYEFSPDESVCKEVLNLEVHCLFWDSGCHWSGRLHDFEGHVGNCGFGSCQGKEMGQAEGYERCSPFEASGGEVLRMIRCVYPECDMVVKSSKELAEHLESECLYRLELHQSEECRASTAKLRKCSKGGIPRVKKEQLNVNQLLQRQVPFLLSGSTASKIKKSRESSLELEGEIAPTPKELTSGNSDTRNTSSRNSVTDRLEQRLNDLENRVAQHDLLIRENALLRQNIRHLSDAFRDVSTKVFQVQHTLDCQKRDFDAFQGKFNALQNEQINLQARLNRLLESPLQHEELARLNRIMEVIQERIERLERCSRSQGGMLANMADAVTALANAVRDGQILGVIQRV